MTVTDRILELGPGSGYFSAKLAAAVPEGHLELLDIQPQMLAKARALLTAAGYANVGYTVAPTRFNRDLPEFVRAIH